MNQELLNQINEQKHRIKDDEIITGIVERARNKFFSKSETEIVLCLNPSFSGTYLLRAMCVN